MSSKVGTSLRDENLIPPAQEDRPLTRSEFCALERMSLSTYHKLKRQRLGPDEIRFPNMTFVRITAEARRAWHAKIKTYRESQTAEIEEQRRSSLASRAGKIAAASPNHISKKRARR
jgi:hypothetical protein